MISRCTSDRLPTVLPILSRHSDGTQAWASPLLADAWPTFLPAHPRCLRCQTLPSMWTLGKDKPVIPGVPFIRRATAIPRFTAGSLWPAFAPARHVCLAVKLPYAITLYARFPTVLREPLRASVTF